MWKGFKSWLLEGLGQGARVAVLRVAIALLAAVGGITVADVPLDGALAGLVAELLGWSSNSPALPLSGSSTGRWLPLAILGNPCSKTTFPFVGG